MSTSDGLTIVGFAITLGVAIVGWTWLRRSDRRTAEALRLAQSAEDRAQRLEDQAIESRDVQWEPLQERNASGPAFRNVGADTAHDVQLIVEHRHAEWPRRTEPHGQVPGGGRIAMNLTTEIEEARSAARERMRNAPPGVLIAAAGGLDIRARITWRSPSGVPGSQDFDDLTL